MLLKTKLYAPPTRDNAIPRERLLTRLGQPAPGQLTLIHAPAGYGKTTLAKQWLDRLRGHYSWLSLDHQDNDPNRFWQYVSGALALPHPQRDAEGNLSEEHLITLINYWQAAAPDFLHLLVLDDFHCIQDEHLLHQVSWFLDRLPHSLHVVITSRTLPPLHVARRRVSSQVMELKAQELCFQSSETRQFLQDTLNLDLHTDTISALHNQTEGWAAALQLAGLSMQRDQPAEPKRPPSTNNSMVDYLAEEVLANQPDTVQAFLLHVTQVRRFSLALCEYALLNTPAYDVRACLSHLREHNLFLIPLDSDGIWFRFHDLFRENLQSLARKSNLHSLTPFLRRAADWYTLQGDEEEAIYCLLQAQLWQDAAQLIEQLGVSRMLAGTNRSLTWWLSRLPADYLHTRPKLALIKAWTLFCTERVLEAEPYLDQADRSLPHNDHGPLRTQILLFRAHIARFRGDDDTAAFWSDQALQHSTSAPQSLNAVTLFAMGLEQFQNGRHPDATTTLEQAMDAARQEHNYFCALSVSVLLAHVYFQCGRTEHALGVLDDTRDWLLAQNQCCELLGRWQNIVYAIIYRETRQLERADLAMEPLLRFQQEGAENGHSAMINLIQAVLHGSHKRWAEALACTDAAGDLMAQDQSHWSAMAPNALMIKAVLHLQQGDRAAALRWSAENEARLLNNQRFATEEERIILARCLALQGRSDEALALLQIVIDATVRAGRVINTARAQLTEAMIHAQNDQLEAATLALDRALHQAAKPGYRQMVFDEARYLQAPLRQLQAQGKQGWWEAAIDTHARDLHDPMVESLTSRELEVLNLIAVGLRNQNIADTLHIALTTTKAHIRHIYEKMDVASRTQAVAKGRELGLIQ